MAGVDVVLRRAHLDGIILPRLAISAVARVAVGISAVSAPKRGKRVVILRLALLLRAAVIAAARALAAAEELAAEGIDAEVIDLRTVSPWDKETVLASIKKTGRVVVAHEAVKQCGFGAELSATIAEEALSDLKGPIVRIGAPFVPIPMTPHLEDLCRTLPKDIAAAARKAVSA